MHRPLILRKNSAQKVTELLLLLLTGGVVYYGLEVWFRGWSHWSMAVCGAVCFLAIYRMNEAFPRLLLPVRALAGSAIITAAEFITGCIVNLWLGLDVWDYSDLPCQFLGQICLPFSVLWFLLCIPVCGISRLIRRTVFYAEE